MQDRKSCLKKKGTGTDCCNVFENQYYFLMVTWYMNQFCQGGQITIGVKEPDIQYNLP
jgi:hypothetical protein